jgi:hypothetical protein
MSVSPSLTQLVPRNQSLVAYWTLGDNAANVFSGSLFCVKNSDATISVNIYLTKYQCNELSYTITGLDNGDEYTVELSLVYDSATGDEVFVAPKSATPVPKLATPSIIGNTAIVFSEEDRDGNNVVQNVKYDVGLTVEFSKPLKNFTPLIEKVYFKFVDTDNSSIRHESRPITMNATNESSTQLTFNFDDIFDSVHQVYVYAVDSNGPSDLSQPYSLTIGTEPNLITIDLVQTMIAGDTRENYIINDTLLPNSPYISGTIAFSVSTNENNSIIYNKSSKLTGIKVAYSYNETSWTVIDFKLSEIESQVTSNGQTVSINNIVLTGLSLNSIVSIKVAGVNVHGDGSYGSITKCSVVKNSLFDSDISLNSCDINDHLNITGSVKLGSLPRFITSSITGLDVPVTYIHTVFSGPDGLSMSYDIPLASISDDNFWTYSTGASVPFTITEDDLSPSIDLFELRGQKSLTVNANIFEIVQVPATGNELLNINDYILIPTTLGTYLNYAIFTNNATLYSKESWVTAFDTPSEPTLVEINDIDNELVKIDVTIPSYSSAYNVPSYLAVVISTSTFEQSNNNLIPALMYDLSTNHTYAEFLELNNVQDLPSGVYAFNLFANSQFKYLSVDNNTKYSFEFTGLTNLVNYYVWTVTFNEQGFSPALKYGPLTPVNQSIYTDPNSVMSLAIKAEEDSNSRIVAQRALLASFSQSSNVVTISGTVGAITGQQFITTFSDLDSIVNLVDSNVHHNQYKNTIVLSWPTFSQYGYTLIDYKVELFEITTTNAIDTTNVVFSNTTASNTLDHPNAILGKKYRFEVTPRVYITSLGSSTSYLANTLSSNLLVSHKSSVIATPVFFAGANGGSVVVGAINHNGRKLLNSKKTSILNIILPDSPTGTETINHLIDSNGYYLTSSSNPELSLYILKLDYNSSVNELKLLYASDSYSYDLLDGLH